MSLHFDSSTLYSLCLIGFFITQSTPFHLAFRRWC